MASAPTGADFGHSAAPARSGGRREGPRSSERQERTATVRRLVSAESREGDHSFRRAELSGLSAPASWAIFRCSITFSAIANCSLLRFKSSMSRVRRVGWSAACSAYRKAWRARDLEAHGGSQGTRPRGGQTSWRASLCPSTISRRSCFERLRRFVAGAENANSASGACHCFKITESARRRKDGPASRLTNQRGGIA